MHFLDNPDRLILIQQFNRVSTLVEVEAALMTLRQWRKLHPDDWGILDAGEELSLLRDTFLDGYLPFVKPASWSEWQWPEHEIIGARTLPAVQDARCALRQWTEEHPNETEPDLLEALFLLLDVVEKRIGKGAQEVQSRRELVGQGA